MTKKEFLEKYKGVIPEGIAMQYSLNAMNRLGHSKDFKKHDTSHQVSLVNGREVNRLGNFKHAHYAGYVEDLINAYRNGDLVWKD